jgi:hypothetical protein
LDSQTRFVTRVQRPVVLLILVLGRVLGAEPWAGGREVGAWLSGVPLTQMRACPYAYKNGQPELYLDLGLQGTRPGSCLEVGTAAEAAPTIRAPVPAGCDRCEDAASCISQLVATWLPTGHAGAERTLWFVGDSILREVAVALRCLLWAYKPPEVGAPRLLKHQPVKLTGAAYPAIAKGLERQQSGCNTFTFAAAGGVSPLTLRICTLKATPRFTSPFCKCKARQTGLRCLRQVVRRDDVLVFGGGAWYGGDESGLRELHYDLKFMARTLVKDTGFHGKIVWVTPLAAHFPNYGGAYNATALEANSNTCQPWNRTDTTEENFARRKETVSLAALRGVPELRVVHAWAPSAASDPAAVHPMLCRATTLDCGHYWLNTLPIVVAKLTLQAILASTAQC